MRDEFIEVVDEVAADCVTDKKSYQHIREVTGQNTEAKGEDKDLPPSKQDIAQYVFQQYQYLSEKEDVTYQRCCIKGVVRNVTSHWGLNIHFPFQVWE